MPSISVWWSPRARWVEKRASSASSGLPHRLAEPPEDAVGVRRDHDPLVVPGLEDVRRRHALEACAAGAANDAEPVVLGHGALEEREARLEERHVDHLPLPEAERVALVQRGQNPLRRVHAGERVAERDVHARRRLAREAVDVADAAHRLRDRREPRAGRVRAGLPVARDARDHEARIRLPELLRREVPALERPGAEVLGQDVAVLDEAAEQLLTALGAEVQRHALLVARLHRPPERTALVARLAPLPQRIGLPRRLDLDHLGAHVPEQAAGEGPGEQHAELDDANTCERARAARVPLAGGRARGRLAQPVSSWARTWPTRTSRASNTCSFITSSARSPSRASSARVICRW